MAAKVSVKVHPEVHQAARQYALAKGVDVVTLFSGVMATFLGKEGVAVDYPVQIAGQVAEGE